MSGMVRLGGPGPYPGAGVGSSDKTAESGLVVGCDGLSTLMSERSALGPLAGGWEQC